MLEGRSRFRQVVGYPDQPPALSPSGPSTVGSGSRTKWRTPKSIMPTPTAVKPALRSIRRTPWSKLPSPLVASPEDDDDAAGHQAADCADQQLPAAQNVDHHGNLLRPPATSVSMMDAVVLRFHVSADIVVA